MLSDLNRITGISSSLIARDVSSCSNSHPLASPDERDDQQRKHPHNNRKAPEGNQIAVTFDPRAYEEDPGERYDAARDADHDEAVTSKLPV